jgi:hypothetical protein
MKILIAAVGLVVLTHVVAAQTPVSKTPRPFYGLTVYHTSLVDWAKMDLADYRKSHPGLTYIAIYTDHITGAYLRVLPDGRMERHKISKKDAILLLIDSQVLFLKEISRDH